MALSQEQERVRQVERVLSSVEAFLKDTIDFEGSSLMAHLRQRGVLTYAQEDVIKCERGSANQVTALLGVLRKGGRNVLDHFIDSLRESGQGHVAEVVMRQRQAILGATSDRAAPVEAAVPAAEPVGPSPSTTAAATRATPRGGAADSSTEDAQTSDYEGFDVSDCAMDVDVKPCTRQFYEEHRKEAYPMNKPDRGKVLIINVEKVRGMAARHGTNVDRDNLTLLFEQLHMIVTVYNDEDGLTAAGIEKKVHDFAESENHEGYQCCVLILLSHGNDGNIFGTDRKIVNVDKLRSYLSSRNCQSLAGKPKLTILQACRGNLAGDIVDHPEGVDESDDLRCDGGDEIIGYPTQPGYKSFRNTKTGSWYITALVDIFQKHARNRHVADLLTKVNAVVSRRTTTADYVPASEQPGLTSSLHKDFYFFPGI